MARNSIAPGGYIGGEPPRRPTFNQLSGVWKLDDVLERQKNNTWTNVLGVEDVFSTWLYTGNGSTQTITNGIDLAGRGGLVWIKQRNGTYSNVLTDTERGAGQVLVTNSASGSSGTYGISSFNSSGFSLDSTVTFNSSTNTFTSWTFRKAAKFFDVVTYTGNGVAGRTVAHSLGSTPGCIIIKRTDTTGTWFVYHRSLGNNQVIFLNSTDASVASSDSWNNTSPTSTNFTLGNNGNVNQNTGTYVAYLFAHDAGGFGDSGNESVIKCGSYTGNGSTTGPVVDLGWEPQWILVKRTETTNENWLLFDNMRGLPVGGNDAALKPNAADAETSPYNYLDVLPTGFQPRVGFDLINASSGNYIYIAIRRGPMKTPTDATKVFKAVTQTSQGTASTDFPVDMVIMGDRSSTWGYNWSTQDRLRGKSAVLFTSATTAENTTSLSTFDSNTSFKDGWVSGGTSAIYEIFRRAPGFFDVVAYTGNSTARTIGHNLNVAPELLILKARSSTSGWITWSSSLSLTENLVLNTNAAKNTGNNFFNSTAPSASVITLSDSGAVNQSSAAYIAYLFASCPGVSKIGTYTGTGTTLSIDCGFTNGARFVLIKRTDSTGDWHVWDTARGIIAANDPYLLLNSTAAEVTSTDYIDPLSSGFQISSTAPAAINANGGSFIYLAIA